MFQKATKKKLRARIALCGPTGSGKTYSALRVGKALGRRLAVIDTERGSASKYSDKFDFDVSELTSYEPSLYVKEIKAAAAAGYDVLVIDSLSHAWTGEGGALDQVDRRAGQPGGKFVAWKEVTPMHRELVDAILDYPGHVIVTMRSKMAYSMDPTTKRVTKLGMAPIQRDGIEYEFDIVGDLDETHTMHVSKSRCSSLADQHIKKPGEAFAVELRRWLDDGIGDPYQEARDLYLAAEDEEGLAKATAKASAWAGALEPQQVRDLRQLHRAAQERIQAAARAALPPPDPSLGEVPLEEEPPTTHEEEE